MFYESRLKISVSFLTGLCYVVYEVKIMPKKTDYTFDIQLAKRIKEACARKGLTQKQLAEALNKAPSQISGYLTENQPTSIPPELLYRISEICDVSLNWLFGKEDNKNRFEVKNDGDCLRAILGIKKYAGDNLMFFEDSFKYTTYRINEDFNDAREAMSTETDTAYSLRFAPNTLLNEAMEYLGMQERNIRESRGKMKLINTKNFESAGENYASELSYLFQCSSETDNLFGEVCPCDSDLPF